jgi:tetratricopeptide (TPR) repeat protein
MKSHKQLRSSYTTLPEWGIMACIALISLVVWWPSLRLEFVNWDDVTYLTTNPAVQQFKLSELFTGFYAGNYHPLTMLSLALEHKIFGLTPMTYHRTNILLHALNAVLVFLLFRRLSLQKNLSLLLSLVFAIHPLRVESVAWVAERKDVLYVAFWLLAALAWLKYRNGQHSLWFWISLLAFLFSCLSKAMAVTLVPVLILLEYYQQRSIRMPSLLPLLPFLFLALATGILAIYAQGSAVGMKAEVSVPERLLFVMYGFWFYIWKTLLPFSLSAFYPYPDEIPVWWYALIPLTLLAILGVFKCKNRMLTFGLAWYILVLLPVIQLLPVGQALVADRYSYLPVIGLLMIVAAGWMNLPEKTPGLEKDRLLFSLFIPLLVFFAWKTRDRILVWKNSITLYEDTLLKYPGYSTGYVNYGNALRDKGDWKKAERAYLLGVYADPDNDLPWNNLGILASFRKQPQKAVYYYEKAASLKPEYPVNYYNIATVWFNQGMPEKALPAAERALKADSLYPEALHLYGVLLQQLRRFPESEIWLNKAVGIKPDDMQILNDLGTTCFYQGKTQAAETAFRKSIQLNPGANPNAYNNLGFVLFNTGRQEEAIAMYQKAAAQGHAEAAAYLRQLGR